MWTRGRGYWDRSLKLSDHFSYPASLMNLLLSLPLNILLDRIWKSQYRGCLDEVIPFLVALPFTLQLACISWWIILVTFLPALLITLSTFYLSVSFCSWCINRGKREWIQGNWIKGFQIGIKLCTQVNLLENFDIVTLFS